MSNKHNIKSLLTELFQFYVSVPDGKEKRDLDKIISMINVGKADLKTILLIINGHIESAKSTKGDNKTLREKNIQFWSYVLNIFVKYLKG